MARKGTRPEIAEVPVTHKLADEAVRQQADIDRRECRVTEAFVVDHGWNRDDPDSPEPEYAYTLVPALPNHAGSPNVRNGVHIVLNLRDGSVHVEEYEPNGKTVAVIELPRCITPASFLALNSYAHMAAAQAWHDTPPEDKEPEPE